MTEQNSEAVAAELEWLAAVIATRLKAFFADATTQLPKPPELPQGSALASLAPGDLPGRIALALGLARTVAPGTLDPLLLENTALKRPFTEFGGTRGDPHGFLPTGETALFLAAGSNIADRAAAVTALTQEDGVLKRQLIRLDGASEATLFDRRLVMSSDTATRILTGAEPQPELSTEFPAQRLTTALGWEDVVLAPFTLDQIRHIEAWLTHEATILDDWGLRRSLAPGYRALFHGPSGTGKTLTAALLGQTVGRPVYRVDISLIVSKYIGETEKNLARIFDRAEDGRWILFFDEADALFGKRTDTKDSHDRYANQEVAYLLQRIETAPGLTILATNLRGNIDAAFARRFQSVVAFARPGPEERRRLWGGLLTGPLPLAKDVDLDALARAHDLTGGAMVNVARHAAIAALHAGRKSVSRADLDAAVSAEHRKEGKTT